ncbi:E3 ubiquitin-protein ligase RNF14-like [Centroberyx affinis]|uniref:E3 ubiquitin-protein ligase RNF14-like n=1 Tax=Centroberyx affinis TaxID=166261 RepID=UPI003A5BDA4B
MSADLEEQEDELLALRSIFSPEEFVPAGEEPNCAGEIRVSVELPADFSVALREGDGLRQYGISFLPPLLLTFDLPEDYPSSSPPSFTLTCSWLTPTQLSALGAHLADLYGATGGGVVLFSWVQFLREEALSFLDIRSLLELPSSEERDPLSSDPSPSVPLAEEQAASLPAREKDETLSRLPPAPAPAPAQTLPSQLLVHNEAQKQRAFAGTVFDCGVCYAARLGSDCVELRECGHVCCRPCMSRFCRAQIEEGNVRGVTCPEADCPATPTPAQVKSLVGEELFSRYDRLLLQSTLDCMPDVVYCPQRSCGSAVILETGSRAALCPACGHAFCVSCRKTYHGVEDCHGKKREKKEKQDAYADVPETEAGMVALWEDYASGSATRRRLLESRYGRRTLRSTMLDALSEGWVAGNSKDCPRCSSSIQKNGGCNMMTCTRCGQCFCWACLTRLSSTASRHFLNSACVGYDVGT